MNFKTSLFLILSVVLLISNKTEANEQSDHKTIKILLIGNSYTFSVAVPFKDIVKQAKKNAIIVDASQGGWTLAQHVSSMETMKKIRSENWDYVTLQERSTIPSRHGYSRMFSSARKLDREIRKKGGKSLFFMPWAYRDGDQKFYKDTFYSMLRRVEKSYVTAAKHLSIRVMPVGLAFEKAFKERPEIELLSGDGTHVHVNGGYLAAYVFYAVIFNESPTKIPLGRYSPKHAKFLKRIAHKTVFGNK